MKGPNLPSVVSIVTVIAVVAGGASGKSLDDLEYRIFPRRTSEEAAVLEWGHSAIISALDASVAQFGPQSSQAALMEVECQPILASPLDGKHKETKEAVKILDNADEINGNMVVMTLNSKDNPLSGMSMANIAKASGAAALCVVNVDEEHPDDIYSLPSLGEEEEEIDIPVVMISLNSANVLTTATVTADMHASEIVNHGMPERVRLYATEDRPFFEDVEPMEPTLYLIHNLLTEDECDALVESAKDRTTPVVGTDLLQMLEDGTKANNVERVMLWKGSLKSRANKEIDERIEQVTGFPADHYSDFMVSKFLPKGYWSPHYDTHPRHAMMATVTVFLQDKGPSVVYPSTADGEPVKVIPRKGLAIVHHNVINEGDTQEDAIHKLDVATLHAFLPTDDGTTFIAQKHVFFQPLSPTRRVVLPFLALPLGGKLPEFVIRVHDFLVEKFGSQDGSMYFDKVAMVGPVLLIVSLAQWISNLLQDQWKKKDSTKKKKTDSSGEGNKPVGKRDKRKKGKIA